MTLRALCLALLIAVFAAPASAGVIVSREGQPICEEVDQLKEFVTAIVERDADKAVSMKTCMMLNEGVRLTLLDGEHPSNVAKVRLLAHGKTFIYYTIQPPAQQQTSY